MIKILDILKEDPSLVSRTLSRQLTTAYNVSSRGEERRVHSTVAHSETLVIT